MAHCPSEAWVASEQDQESAENASDQERLAALDAYGHLAWTVGFGSEDDADWDTRGDMLWCFDFSIWDDIDRGVVIAYHVVANSESGSFIETQESAVVPVSEAPYNLPERCVDRSLSADHQWRDDELTQAQDTNDMWNADLKRSIAAALNEAFYGRSNRLPRTVGGL